MLSVKDLTDDTRTVTVAYDGHDVHVTYRPSTINTPFTERIGSDSMAALIADAAESWDVVDEHGGAYPITVESVGALNVGFQRRVLFEGILEDASQAGLPEVPAPSDAS